MTWKRYIGIWYVFCSFKSDHRWNYIRQSGVRARYGDSTVLWKIFCTERFISCHSYNIRVTSRDINGNDIRMSWRFKSLLQCFFWQPVQANIKEQNRNSKLLDICEVTSARRFPTQKASNVESVSTAWCHHVTSTSNFHYGVVMKWFMSCQQVHGTLSDRKQLLI